MPKFEIKNSAAQNLIASNKAEEPKLADAHNIDIDKIVPNPFQVRQNFTSDDAVEALQQLANDIKVRGILQPLVVRRIAPGKYEIVAGERRYRAAKEIGLKRLPVIVHDMDDEEARMTSLVENVQRKDLDIDEEARFLAALKNEYDLSEKEIRLRINKSQTYVAKRLKLAEYPDLLERVRQGLTTINNAYEEATSRETPKSQKDGRTKLARAKTQQGGNADAPIYGMANNLFRGNKLTHVPFQHFNKAIIQIEQTWANKPSDEQQTLLEELAVIEAQLAELRLRLKPQLSIETYPNENLVQDIDPINSIDVEPEEEEDNNDFLLPTPSRTTVRKR